MPRTRPAILAATALAAWSVVVLSGCSAGSPTGQAAPAAERTAPGSTVSAPAPHAAVASTGAEGAGGPATASAAPVTADAATPSGRAAPALPDVVVTDDYFADLERYWPDADGIDTDLAIRMIEDVCDASVADGDGAGPAEGSPGAGDAGFSEDVRRYGLQGEVQWALPLVVAEHHCPDRVEAVGMVQRYVEAGASA
jgi:hypothetical protein